MTSELSIFAAQLREFIHFQSEEQTSIEPEHAELMATHADAEFNGYAMLLFALQFKANASYRKLCEARGITPNDVTHWTQIPAAPASAFKELEMTCLPPDQRLTVFHSSGTTEQKPSRHYHNAESLAIYEASLWPWFEQNVVPDFQSTIYDLRLLTPPPSQAPRSSLVHMFDAVRKNIGATESVFMGRVAEDGAWTLDFDEGDWEWLSSCHAAPKSGGGPPHSTTLSRSTPAPFNAERLGLRQPSGAFPSQSSGRPLPATLLLGTAFSFVHLLDFMAERDLRVQLPAGSVVMETGGYKGRSRSLPKAELHALITERLSVPSSHIICEYGMSELSSQAYDTTLGVSRIPHRASRAFHFPPWARAQVISPETGQEVADGETGLIRVFDLANVFSVMAIQTEDLGVRRGSGFELIGRAEHSEVRGCSLMAM